MPAYEAGSRIGNHKILYKLSQPLNLALVLADWQAKLKPVRIILSCSARNIPDNRISTQVYTLTIPSRKDHKNGSSYVYA